MADRAGLSIAPTNHIAALTANSTPIGGRPASVVASNTPARIASSTCDHIRIRRRS